MTSIDRRQLIKRASAAGAAAGAVWVTPSVVGSSSAFAEGSAPCATCHLVWKDVSHSAAGWDFQPGSTTSDPNSGYWDTKVSYLIQPTGTCGGRATWVKMTVTPVAHNDGTTDHFPKKGTTGSGVSTSFSGSPSSYKLNMVNDDLDQGFKVTFEFLDGNGPGATAVSVSNLTFSLIDIDRLVPVAPKTDGFNDKMWLEADPTSAAFTSTEGSKVDGTGSLPDPWLGTTTADETGADLRVDPITFTSPVNSVSVFWESAEFTNYNHSIAIGDLSWCS